MKFLKKYKWFIIITLSLSILLLLIIFKPKINIHIIDPDDKIVLPPPSSSGNKGKKDKYERKCREILERIYKGKKFNKIRPDWLRNPKTNRNLELDCYNEELKISLEYQGAQHTHFTPFFHKTEADLQKQIERDNFKKKKCEELGITFITVPFSVEYKDLEKYLRDRLPKQT